MKVYGKAMTTVQRKKIVCCLRSRVETCWRSRRLSLNSILRSRHRAIRKRDLSKPWKKLGIGRPSTYAPTLETIQKRGYVAIEEIYADRAGRTGHRADGRVFQEILNVEFTANMEGDLDHVEEGSEDWVKVLAEFYESFEKRLGLPRKK